MQKKLAIINCNQENSTTGEEAARKVGVEFEIISLFVKSMNPNQLCERIVQGEFTHVIFDNIPLESGRMIAIHDMGKYIWPLLCHHVKTSCYLGERQDKPAIYRGDWRDWSLVRTFPFIMGNEPCLYAGWIAEEVCTRNELATALRSDAKELKLTSGGGPGPVPVVNRWLDLANILDP